MAHSSRHVLFIGLCIACIIKVETANILALMTAVSPSHHVWNRVLVQALADRGHNIVYISPDTDTKFTKNIKQIQVEGVYADLPTSPDDFNLVHSGQYKKVLEMSFWGKLGCKLAAQSHGVQTLKNMSSTHSFDLVIVDYTTNECMLGFIPLFNNPPTIGVCALGGHVFSDLLTGSPPSLAYKPIMFSTYSSDMNLFQKLNNVCLYWYSLYEWYFVYLPFQQQLADNVFGNIPPLLDILNRINVFLINTHFIFDFSSPKTPGLVPVAGLQITPAKQLPKDIEDYLDSAKDGAIYFALGTNVKSSRMNPEKLKILLDCFKELAPIKILWKWENELLPGKPENVKIAKWLPQRDILHHPNVKLFFTHAGLLSTHEAIYEAVPVVGMPVIADQQINLHRIVDLGIGVHLDYETINKDNVLKAITTVLNNKRYKQRITELSKLFRDEKESPLERAVFWTEYVLRHNGASHMRSPGRDLHWYQHFLLDAIFLLLLIFTIVSVIAFKLGQLVRKIIYFQISKLKKE